MKTYLPGYWALGAVVLTLAACSGSGGGGSAGGSAPPAPSANSAPSIAGVDQSQSIAQDSSSEPITFIVDDSESGASGVTVSAQSSNPELIPPDALVVSGNGGSRTLQVTPEAGVSGTAKVTLTATDAQGQSVTQSLDVTVTSEERSFKEMVDTVYAGPADADAQSIVGYKWVDNPTDDPNAFDALLQ